MNDQQLNRWIASRACSIQENNNLEETIASLLATHYTATMNGLIMGYISGSIEAGVKPTEQCIFDLVRTQVPEPFVSDSMLNNEINQMFLLIIDFDTK